MPNHLPLERTTCAGWLWRRAGFRKLYYGYQDDFGTFFTWDALQFSMYVTQRADPDA